MLDFAAFLFGEALTALRRNLTMTFAAVSTVAISLFLLGGIGALFRATEGAAQGVSDRFEMRVWLRPGATRPQISRLAGQIRGIEGVRGAYWIPRDRAWAKMREEMPDVTEGLENPLPDAFKIVVQDLGRSDQVAKAVVALPGVDSTRGVQYLKAEQQLFEQVRGFLRWIGTGLGLLLGLVAGVLIYNSIRLSVFARRREARVMSLVGASRAAIRVPYLVEGILQGVLGGGLAVAMLKLAHGGIEGQLRQFPALGTVPPFPWAEALVTLLPTGALYGLLCSYLALWWPMKG